MLMGIYEIYLVAGIIAVVIIFALYYYRTATPKRRRKEVLEVAPPREVIAEREVEGIEIPTPKEPIDLREVKGIGPKWSKKLADEGVTSVQDLAALEATDLAKKVGVSEKVASRWIKGAKEILVRGKS